MILTATLQPLVDLYLLDSNDPVNAPRDQGITNRLYGGSPEERFMQQIALGIGGWRIIEALDLPVHVCHLNEGHAALVTIERARRYMEHKSISFEEALWATRAGNIFTTHTPVAAAFDVISPPVLQKYLLDYTRGLGISPASFAALGKANSEDEGEGFNMAYLAMRTCSRISAVSELHGEVSRNMFRDLYPRWPTDEVPITHVTNGIHVPTWDSARADTIWTESCGKGRWRGSCDNFEAQIAKLSNEELWEFRGNARRDLVQYLRDRLAHQLAIRGAPKAVKARALGTLDPNILTLGFARRFAEYKRPNLLLQDQNRLAKLLTDPATPVQIIVAGKAHPDDRTGKALLQQWVNYAMREDVRDHVVFLDDYDMALAQELVQGVDLWLNTPRRPWEACGTSGMKVLANGGLNLSSKDGWWAEAYCEECGWALEHSQLEDVASADAEEALHLYELLEQEIVPGFYQRDSAGIPVAWVKRMRNSMAKLAPQFSSNRMLREYTDQLYLPAIEQFKQRSHNGNAKAKHLSDRVARLKLHWPHVHWGDLTLYHQNSSCVFTVQLYLGDIDPDWVRVELYAEPMENHIDEQRNKDGDSSELTNSIAMERAEAIPGAIHGYVYRASVDMSRRTADFTPRVMPCIDTLSVPAEISEICWWNGNREIFEQHATEQHTAQAS